MNGWDNIGLIVKNPYIRPFLLLSLLVTVTLPNCHKVKAPEKQVINGVLDLSDWSFETDGIVRLNGMWEFYWNRLLEPSDFKVNPDTSNLHYMRLPSIWNKYEIEGIQLPGTGYATYHLLIKRGYDSGALTILMPSAISAYSLWVNDVNLLQNGVVGKSKELMLPAEIPLTAVIPSSDDNLEITIQVSNFYHSKGGIRHPIYIGIGKQILQKRAVAIALELVVLGALIIMSFYHILPFSLHRQDRTSLYFGIFCLLMAFRIVLTGNRLLCYLIPSFPWGLNVTIDYLCFIGSVTFFSRYLLLQFENYVSKRLMNVLLIISIVFGIYVVAMPVMQFSRLLDEYSLIIFIFGSYGLLAIASAMRDRNRSAFIVFFGFLIFLLTVINDMMFFNELSSHRFNLIPLGLFLFTFAQSFVLSVRFSKLFATMQSTNSVFVKFVPKQFLEKLSKENVQHIELGKANTDTVSVMFSDIRSFTQLTQDLSPQETLNFLNSYFARMTEPINENHGFVDKFVGDEIMVLFDRQGDNATDAVRAAIAMQDAVEKYNCHRASCNYPPISTGSGIHSGEVVIGTVGSDDRMDSTVLGDVVNLSSRLEGLTKKYRARILISLDTYKAVNTSLDLLWREVDFVHVKGKHIPTCVIEIFNCDPEPQRDLKIKINDQYQKALELYYSRNWKKSKQIFYECLEHSPDDVVLQMYIERCRQFIKEPPGPDWIGDLR